MASFNLEVNVFATLSFLEYEDQGPDNMSRRRRADGSVDHSDAG